MLGPPLPSIPLLEGQQHGRTIPLPDIESDQLFDIVCDHFSFVARQQSARLYVLNKGDLSGANTAA
jgi:hypothetical protein